MKGRRTTAEIIKGADVSRETFRKIERGQLVKVPTLKKICDYLGADKQQWSEILAAAMKLKIGNDARHLNISYGKTPNKQDQSDRDQVVNLVEQLDEFDRQQIIMAMMRPQVRSCLPSINKLYDQLKKIGK